MDGFLLAAYGEQKCMVAKGAGGRPCPLFGIWGSASRGFIMYYTSRVVSILIMYYTSRVVSIRYRNTAAFRGGGGGGVRYGGLHCPCIH